MFQILKIVDSRASQYLIKVSAITMTLFISMFLVIGVRAENIVDMKKTPECGMQQYVEEALKYKKEIKPEYRSEANKIAQNTREMTLQHKNDVLEVKRRAFSNMNNYTRKSEMFGKSGNVEDSDHRKLVFISLSLSDKNVEQIVSGAKAHGFTPVLRGFKDGSYVKTAEFLSSIITKTGFGVVIDPESFKEFDVRAVPTFVVAEAKVCIPGDKCVPPKYNKVSGNVTFDYVLNLFASDGDKL